MALMYTGDQYRHKCLTLVPLSEIDFFEPMGFPKFNGTGNYREKEYIWEALLVFPLGALGGGGK